MSTCRNGARMSVAGPRAIHRPQLMQHVYGGRSLSAQPGVRLGAMISLAYA